MMDLSLVHSAINKVMSLPVVESYSFWSVFHIVLGLGVDVKYVGGEKVIDRISNNHTMIRGASFRPTKYGLDVMTFGEPGTVTYEAQGHRDQFVAEMFLRGVKPSHEIKVNGSKYQFSDFVKESMATARVGHGQELSWSLITIGHTHGPKITWVNKFGERLSYDSLIEAELNAPIIGAACGGTHRLFGLSFARKLLAKHGIVNNKLSSYLRGYFDLALKLQNHDGTYSINYFSSSGSGGSVNGMLASSGHTFEWLAYEADDADLGSLLRGANAVSRLIINNGGLEVGGLYHATHGLNLFDGRIKSLNKLQVKGDVR